MYLDLCEKQNETMGNPSVKRLKAESAAMYKWQHSKIHWFDVGDGNNKFFHSSAKIREIRNAIHEIVRADGSIAKTDEKIKKEAENFFVEVMTLQPMNSEGASVESLNELLGFQCSEVDCSKLEERLPKKI